MVSKMSDESWAIMFGEDKLWSKNKTWCGNHGHDIDAPVLDFMAQMTCKNHREWNNAVTDFENYGMLFDNTSKWDRGQYTDLVDSIMDHAQDYVNTRHLKKKYI